MTAKIYDFFLKTWGSELGKNQVCILYKSGVKVWHMKIHLYSIFSFIH